MAGFYIDKQIIASTKLIELPDGSKKAEPDLTESDYESMLLDLTKKHKISPSPGFKDYCPIDYGRTRAKLCIRS